jgi:hypothetical protein
VTLNVDFAGIKAGSVMYIGSPVVFANYLERIPRGETRTIERMRNELARRNDAGATCPVTTAIFLKVVAEVALAELRGGTPPERVVPFWRVVAPDSKVAKGLSCDSAYLADLRASEAAGPPAEAFASQRATNAPSVPSSKAFPGKGALFHLYVIPGPMSDLRLRPAGGECLVPPAQFSAWIGHAPPPARVVSRSRRKSRPTFL